ncbi:MAG: SMC family ATPase [Nakamurella sp.]
MRLHRLEVSAFGPFADTQVVDLDALGADGLFLVQGDTGAGKTTLLDAVAFALFGRVPGPRNEAKRLRCDRSPADVVTQVRLEATIGGHRLEITRRPEYPRPKSRGEGTTLQRGKVTLRWLGPAPSGQPDEGLTRADEIGDAVIDMLGMSADQFFQVVLLPQGDFARFLRADTNERGDLLERLFDTGRFGRIEDWFAVARRDAGARLRECDEVVRQQMARVAEAARIEPPAVADHIWLADLRDLHADRAAYAGELADRARSRRDAAAAEQARAKDLAGRIDRLRELRRRMAELAASRPEVDHQRTLISRHGKTAAVVSAAAQLEAAKSDCSAAARRRRTADRALAEVLSPSAGADPLDLGMLADDPPTVRAAAKADRELAEALTVAMAEAAEQQRDLDQLVRARQRHHRDEVAAVDVEQRLAGLPARITELEGRIAGARGARDQLPKLHQQVTATELVVRAARSAAEREQQVVAAVKAATRATDLHQSAVDRRQALVDARIAGMAAELATDLAVGDPCPVCGSPEHPQLAEPAATMATAAAISAALQSEQAAAQERDRTVQQRSKLEQALTHDLELSAGRSVADAEAELAELVHRHHRAAAVGRNLDALLGLREVAGKALFEQSLRREDLATALAAGTAEIGELTQRTEKRVPRLNRAQAGHGSVQARRAFLLTRATALDSVADCAAVAATATRALARAEQALATAVTDGGFGGLEAALHIAALDVDALEQRVRKADDDYAAVSAQLVDPQFAGLHPSESVDLVGIGAVAAEAADTAERAITLAHAAREQLEQVCVAAQRLGAACRNREPVAEQEAEIAALTDVMLGRGQNVLGTSLRTYVLAERLKQVAVVAGQRLDQMSAGRYTFVHSTDRESRGRAGGLGLDILDGWSGLVRSAKTLSGGEAFLASLALALGLADVVAAEAGGRVLDTLFVDEGFGSLDPDALDLVMGTLDELRAGGRVVGVVSHVDELRQRIPSQVRVCRTPKGSTLEVTCG